MNKKLFIGLILVIIAAVSGLLFFSAAKNEEKEIEAEMNSAYTDYIEHPEAFKLTKAKIVEEYDCDTGFKINFFPESNQWIVDVIIDENTSCSAYVMRDVKKDKVGDIIDVAYEINPDNNYNDENMYVTQLRYIEETGAMKSYNILIVCMILVSISAFGYLLYTIIKSR